MESEKHEQLSHSDHLLVFLSLIFACIVVEFLSKLNVIINSIKSGSIYLPYLLWVLITFVLVIQIWWGIYFARYNIGKNIGYFFFFLFVPILLYIVPESCTENGKKFKTIRITPL